MQLRSIQQRVSGTAQTDGAGVKLTRVLGRPTVEDFDPFLMLDAFDSINPDDYIKGFPMHPHRGIETITYLLHGQLDHEDSLGNRGTIEDGGCQWMTAGHGIMHQEMPQPTPQLLGAQLWLNMPQADKLSAPSYGDIDATMIPTVQKSGSTTRIIGGEYDGVTGAMQGNYVQMQYLDVMLEANAAWQVPTPVENTAFIYIISGSLTVGDDTTLEGDKQALLFTKGDTLRLNGGPAGARLLYFCARPLQEPVAWGGPIVMNTGKELQQAWLDMRSGTFIRKF